MAETTVDGKGVHDVGGLCRVVAGPLSLGAGLLHASVVPAHSDHTLVAAFFVVVATAQVLWAVQTARRPSPRLLLAGAIGNALVVVVWIASRSTGLPLVDGATSSEPVGLKDSVTSLFELLLIGAVVFSMRPGLARRPLPVRVGTRPGLALTAVVAMLGAPAFAASSDDHGHVHLASAPHGHADGEDVHGHAKGEVDHGHDDGDEHAHDGEPVADSLHAHAGPTSEAQTHGAHAVSVDHDDHASAGGSGHAHGDQVAAGVSHAPSGGHSHGGPCNPTPEQQAATARLIEATRRGLEKYRNVGVALAAGYVPAHPHERVYHYVNPRYRQDPAVLDANRIESILYAMTDDGFVPIGGMYMMPAKGQEMPEPGGCLTQAHTHTEVFVDPTGETVEMMHVWIVDMPGGPSGHPDPDYVSTLWTPGGREVPMVCWNSKPPRPEERPERTCF